ncbi:unnamed protein product [Rhizoctonia solani]|uniref:Uncharacterized protein n=1 Tax=Rhizoctonia solani TaxID=456999 RepID=A0A8H3HQH9_9AGAM|nr:unnamed protein product [Rhizoctonia solani]
MSRLTEGARFNLKEELSRCLWQERLEATVVEAIRYYVRGSADSIIEGAARGSKRMSLLLGNVNQAEFPRNQLDFSSIQGDVQKGFLRAFLKICQHHINIAQARYSIEAFEGQYPLWKQFGATIVGLVVTALAYPAIILFPYITFGSETFGILRDDSVILDMCKTYQVNPRAMVWAFTPAIEIRQVKYAVLGMFRENADRGADSVRKEGAFKWNMHLAYGWAEELGLILEKCICPSQRNVPGALAFLNSVFPGFIWENCLLGCVSKKMGECVRREIEHDEERVKVHSGNGDVEPGPSECTVQEFQQRLLARIKIHAKRVDQFQLAEALVVETGMANAMSEIWASLPSDFGSMRRRNN